MKMAMFPFLLFFKINNQPEPIKLVAMKNYYGLTLVIRMRAAKYKWVLGTIAAYQLVECATCEVNCENSEIHKDYFGAVYFDGLMSIWACIGG